VSWYLLIGIGIVAIVLLFVRLKKRQDELAASIERRFRGKRIRMQDKHAFFIALKSDGYSHSRGQGYLVLSDEELYFERLIARKVVPIPFGAIVSAGKTRRLAGQNLVRNMLQIEFKDKNGNLDAIGLVVKELDRWIQEINKGPYPG
jgi:hypothetical protein